MLKRFLALAALILCLILPEVALAQAPVTLPAVEIDLWPEYDDPGVLVIYRITLPSSISLPAEFKLRIPAAAGSPNAVAAKQPDNSLVNLSYQQQMNGAWNELTITATSPELQLEYYDPSLEKDGQKRTYSFEWPGDYAVQAFKMQVQQPFDATQMKISPDDFGTGQSMGDGMTYYAGDIGPIPSGPPFKILVNYNKASDNPSIRLIKGTSPVLPTRTNSNVLAVYLPWILGILGLGLIVGGTIWFILVRREPAQQRVHNRSTRKKAPINGSVAPNAEGYIYCPQCGKRASPGDRFCRTCGSALRT